MKPRQKRLSLLISAVLGTALAGWPLASMAQKQEDSTENSVNLDKVQVTGSRIKQAGIEGIQPLQVLDREDIERTGLTSVGDILQQLTLSGSAINTRFNSSGNFGFPPNGGGIGAGATRVDMRHLGSGRVLVLVDGLRWVPGSSGSGVSNAVDMNTIPVGIIERIEILKDGASAIYGADAIAGVINIITKKDFTGGEGMVYGGMFDAGDGETGQVDLTFGQSSDRMNVVLNIGYTNQEPVSAADRKLSAFPKPYTGVTRGSSGTPQGRFLFNTPGGTTVNCTINNGVTGIPSFDPNNPCSGDDFHPFTNDDRFNYASYNLYVTPSERMNIYGAVTMQLTDKLSWHTKVLYNNRQSTNQAAPEPIFIGPFAEAGQIADNIIVSANNPYNPFGQDLFTDGFGFIGRRPLEAGPRVFNQDVDTIYAASQLQGAFDGMNHTWYWELAGAYGRNRADQLKDGALNIRHIADALGDPDACAALPGCVPLNLFGGQGDGSGTITQEMLDYISFVQHDTSQQELTTFNANISSDLFELPAGPLGFAAGYEYRKHRGFFQPDAVVVAGESNGVPASPTKGEYDVNAFYAEAVLPILADQPGADLLDVSLAVRSEDYSTSGSATTGKFGVRYMPNEELLIRATYAEGLRAPSIGELFGNQARFDAVLDDPCNSIDTDNDGVPDTTPDLPGCAGVPDGYQQTNPQIPLVTGGNPNLQPEESTSYTAGVVYSPNWAENLSWAPRLDFEWTYYDISLEKAIQAVDAATILETCAVNPAEAVCDSFSRDAFGNIERFENTLTNIGGIDTSGWDLNVHWTSPDTDWGQFAVSWYNSVVKDYVEINPSSSSPTGFVERHLEGLEQSDSAIPRWKSNLVTTWGINQWKVTWSMRFVSRVTEKCSDFLDGTPNSLTQLGLCSDPNFDDESKSLNSLGGTTYHDLQVSLPNWHKLEIQLGVNNIFDRDPPACFSCSLNGYDPSTYDPEGRFLYGRVKFRF